MFFLCKPTNQKKKNNYKKSTGDSWLKLHVGWWFTPHSLSHTPPAKIIRIISIHYYTSIYLRDEMWGGRGITLRNNNTIKKPVRQISIIVAVNVPPAYSDGLSSFPNVHPSVYTCVSVCVCLWLLYSVPFNQQSLHLGQIMNGIVYNLTRIQSADKCVHS